MAETNSSLQSWELQSQESDRRFYGRLNDLRINLGMLPITCSNSMEDLVYDRTILVKIHDLKYSISCRELDMVFSRFGALEQVEILSLSSQFHFKVCFQNVESARRACEFLNHQCIYDFCCRLELCLMREVMIETPKKVGNECNTGIVGIQETSLDSSTQETQISIGIQEFENSDSIVQGTQGNNSIEVFEDLEINGDSTESEEMMVSDDLLLDSMENGVAKEVVVLIGAVKDDQRFSRYDELIVLEMGNGPNIGKEPSSLVARIVFDELPDSKICREPELLVEISKEIGTTSQDELNVKVPAMMMNQEQDNLKAIPYIAEALALGVAYGKLGEFVDESLDSMEIRGHENRVFDPGDFRDPRFAKKAGLEHLTFSMMEEVVVEQKCSYPSRVRADRVLMPYDRGRKAWIEEMILPDCTLEESCDPMIFLGPDFEVLVELLCDLDDCFGSIDSFTFDPGGRIEFPLQTLVITVFDPGIVHTLDLQAVLIDGCWVLGGLIFVFDPGGIVWWHCCPLLFPCSSLKILAWLLGLKPWRLQFLLACYVSFPIVQRTIWIIAWPFGCQLQVLVLLKLHITAVIFVLSAMWKLLCSCQLKLLWCNLRKVTELTECANF